MSETPPSPPSTDTVKATTEELASFAQWIAELVQRRNWFTLLLLADVVLFFGFKQQGGIIVSFLQQYFGLELPGWYGTVFWFTLLGIFVAAIALAIKTMPRWGQLEAQEGDARRVVKGLRAFTAEDADIFARLQRESSVQNCLESLSRPEFRFGILMGESGCGKTSLLRAGVLPRLNHEDAPCQAVYIRFSDRAPEETIRAALLTNLNPPSDWQESIDPSDFLSFLKASQAFAQKPLVLILDQFEQFFTTRRQASDRQPFIQALTEWYEKGPETAVTILISIRADLLHELYELQQAMGYSLGRYDVFKLEKFYPAEATNILQVIAEAEGWPFDHTFVMKLAQEELHDADSKISPVDLQILAETIRKQPAEQRAFKEETFRKMVGLEGLLNRYLEETLDVLKLQNLHQAAIQVLLTLIDRERNLRAGILTVEAIQEQLKGIVPPQQATQTTTWLASGEVRLISPVEQPGKAGYELAHERLIPAVVSLAGQSLEVAAKANRLLERRVNEWLGNNRSARYLLSWQELRLLQQHRKSVVWGRLRRDKEQLLQRSWRRLLITTGTIFTPLLLISCTVLLWLSPAGQLWQIRWELVRLIPKVAPIYHPHMAVAFARSGDFKQAIEIKDKVSDDEDLRMDNLSGLATVYRQFRRTEDALIALQQAEALINVIPYPVPKTTRFTSLAQEYYRLEEIDAAVKALKQATDSAQAIPEIYLQVFFLTQIITTYDQMVDTDAAVTLLSQTITSIDLISDPSDKAYLLSVIAPTYSQLSVTDTSTASLKLFHDTVEMLPDSHRKAIILSRIAIAYHRSNMDESARATLDQAQAINNVESDVLNQLNTLSAIAEARNFIGDTVTAITLLEKTYNGMAALENLNANEQDPSIARQNLSDQEQILETIATVSSRLNDTGASLSLLNRLPASVNKLFAPTFPGPTPDQPSHNQLARSRALRKIVQSYGKVKDINSSLTVLKQLHSDISTIADPHVKAFTLSAIAETYMHLDAPGAALATLEEARTSAEAIADPLKERTLIAEVANLYMQLNNSKGAIVTLKPFLMNTEPPINRFSSRDLWPILAKAQADLKAWWQVNKTADACLDPDCEASVLFTALETWAEQRYPELREEEEDPFFTNGPLPDSPFNPTHPLVSYADSPIRLRPPNF